MSGPFCPTRITILCDSGVRRDGVRREIPAEPVPGTEEVFWHHPSHDLDGGHCVTHADSGLWLLRAPTAEQACDLARRLWDGLSAEGRAVFRDGTSADLVKRLPRADVRLAVMLRADARTLMGEVTA